MTENGFPYSTHGQQITKLAKGQEAKSDLANILHSIQTHLLIEEWLEDFLRRNRAAKALISML